VLIVRKEFDLHEEIFSLKRLQGDRIDRNERIVEGKIRRKEARFEFELGHVRSLVVWEMGFLKKGKSGGNKGKKMKFPSGLTYL
jgi:hypothetical protein